MPYWVRLKTDDRKFVVSHGEAILEAALKAGLNVAYGCNNGNCGLCAAQLISGKINKIKDSDYVFEASRKAQHYFLMCANTPASDSDIVAEIADGSEEIPLQYFRAKLCKVDKLNEQLTVVRMRVARSHRLRFMAGQSILLKHRNYGSQCLAIASCPCDATELEFHIRCDSGQVSHSLCEHCRLGEWFELAGPYGHFTFSENLERPVILIACDLGFASSKSLIEHIVARESELPVHLYRVGLELPIYMENLCFAWRDALDQFTYSILRKAPLEQFDANNWAMQISNDYSAFSELDFYLCLHGKMLSSVKSALLERGALLEHIFYPLASQYSA